MPSDMRISVNNKTVDVSGRRPLIEELRLMGIEVPSMCYGPDRDASGEYGDTKGDTTSDAIEHHPSCMVCMVKDVRSGQMLPSCATMPYEGMSIETDSDEVHDLRRMSLELLLSDHKIRCGVCEGKAKCRLRELALQMGAKWTRYGKISPSVGDDQVHVNGRLYFEPAKCIRCGLCVYNTGDGFTFERRGFDMRVVIPEASRQNVSEQTALLCPTGALILKLLLPLMLLLSACRSLPDDGTATASLPDAPQLLWEHRHDVRTVAAPVAYDGMIVMCDKHGQLKGLDEMTGEQQLSLSLGADVEASFTIDDSTLYVGQLDGRVRSLSMVDGSELWEYATEGQIAAAPVVEPLRGSDRRLYVGSYDNYMYTLLPQTGSLVSRVATGYYINGAVALWNGHVVFGGCDAWVRLVDGSTGECTDSLQLDAYIPASPVVDGDNAYVADYRGNVYELTLEGSHISRHRKLLTAADDDGGMLSVPVVNADRLYLLTTDRSLLCIDRRDGRQVWKVPLKGDSGESSPVLAGDRLLVCTKSGVVTIHDAASGRQLWEYETGEQIITRPVVGDSRFYVLTARGTMLGFGD